MQTKYVSVRIVTGDIANLCGKEACPHFAVRSSSAGAYRASCRLFGAPLGTGNRGPVGMEGTVPRCDGCMRAKEL
jgi:hypothetical protein